MGVIVRVEVSVWEYACVFVSCVHVLRDVGEDAESDAERDGVRSRLRSL